MSRPQIIGLTLLLSGALLFAAALLIPEPKPLMEVTGLSRNPDKVLMPIDGKIYHAISPAQFSGWQKGDRDTGNISELEEMVGKEIAWVSVSNTWFPADAENPCLEDNRISQGDTGIHFPTEDVEQIVRAGYIPSIRMLPYDRCISKNLKHFKLQNFIDGEFDEELRAWAEELKAIPSPVLLTFGVEMNGFWFPWNLRYNGGSEKTGYGDPALYDGHERFRDAYRHIIDLFREEGVKNATWIYHINCIWPTDVNNPEADVDAYYPGDEYIDWIGVSCYGSQDGRSDFWWPMSRTFDIAYEAVVESEVIGKNKPIALMEYGVVEDPKKPAWMRTFFADIEAGKYPRLKALAWWQSDFCLVFDERERDGCRATADLRIQSSEESLEAYRDFFADDRFIGEPVFRSRVPLVQ